ncbi:polypeptide-transport-associated shlb-type [Lucifera butyrica]|uniref:Polypeptide-transport-associated shlb-type n=1 Tax=Lucifera butyrica TaxID=1351585 RepID=A0A498RGV8_9FIRM|nr:ShlB/FhaC/HecB family hemolysin secretion/activation protein [Lucifera butyrica]VBB09343.1 polypeptide-transport-associated shlb-type [Lucifera butyrica]
MNLFRSQSLQKSIVLTAAILLLGQNWAWAAQAPNRTDIEDQNRRARQEAQDRQQRAESPDVFLQKGGNGEHTIQLPEETPSFVIHTFQLEGDHLENFLWLQPLLNQYAGAKIGKEGINLLAKLLTESLIDRGYITTRVLIPQQNLSSGVLRFRILPGIIQDIRFVDPTIRGIWQSAFPVRPGDILNLRDLEQGLEQMKRVPSQDVDMQLLPGDKPGASMVAITVKQAKPWKVIFSLDDSGSQATGKLQESATFSYDNFLGINDLFNVSLNCDADRAGSDRGTSGNSFYYSFPQGYWTYSISHSYYQYHQTVANSGNSFVSSGQMDDWNIEAERLLHRDQRQKTSLAFAVSTGLNQYFMDDTEIGVERQQITTAKLALRQKQYNGQTVLNWELAAQRGVPWFGAEPDPQASSADSPTTRFTVWTADATLTAPVHFGNPKAQYTAVLHGQYTKNTLFASQCLSIGNRYTVRGFDGEQTLSGETGWYWRNELSFPQANSGEFYLGLDCGHVYGPTSALSPGRFLLGSVLGVRGNWQGAQYDVFLGFPLRKPAALETASPTLGFQLIYQL